MVASATRKQREFFGFWGQDLSQIQLKNRTRAMVFELLAEEILCRPCFGLDGTESAGELEQGLINFETNLSSIRGHEDEVTEWRIRTVKCAKLLQDHDAESTRPRRAVAVIGSFLEPIMLPRHQRETAKDRDGLEEYLLALCTTAYKLTLTLRGCKDLYRCETPSPGSPQIDEDADPQDFERSRGPKSSSSDIAFAIHGALVKYPEHSAKDRLVLEKAHVVVYR